MRTTVTIDPDLAAKLRAIARERRISLTKAVNAPLRAGISEAARAARPYRVPARRLGLRYGPDLDRALHLAAGLEDAETIRRLDPLA